MSKAISNVIDNWSKFDIKTIQHELDEKVIEIAQQLEEGDQSRKKLIEQTKEFRKGLTEEQRKLIGPILKSFQVEVDTSTKRTKTMEQVLLKLYKQLIELPDPGPILENAQRLQKKAERAQDLELENKQLRETLDEYNAEFAEVKNQEVTIKMLKDKIKELEERTEVLVQQKVRDREKEMTRLFGEKEEQIQNSQLELAKKLGDTEARNQGLQNQLQKVQNELYDFKAKQDEILNAKERENEILMQDLEKMNERAVNAERLLEQYTQFPTKQAISPTQTISELSESSTAAITSMANELNQQQQQLKEIKYNYQTSTLEIELVAKEKEISQLVDDIQKLQAKANKDRALFDNERAQLEDKLMEREKALESLENELRLKKDYDEIKNELKVLKTIEFTSTSFDPSASEGSENQAQKSLEILLLEKNRYLQNENTQVKNKLSEIQLKYDQISVEHKSTMKLNVEQKALIAELERDLYQVARKPNQQAQALIEPTQSASNPTILDLESSLQSSQVNALLVGSSEPIDESSGQTEGPGGPQDDRSLLNIVSNQRERYRARVQELETENLTNKQQVLFLTNELDRLRSDNLKLYEKIKFLQSSYTPSNGVNSKAKSSTDNDALYSDDSGLFNKYTNEYEQRLDPFSKFSYREKQKRYTNLKLHDKFTLNFGRFILSSRLARLIFCAYFFIIHFMIFGSLYYMASSGASHRDVSAECARSYSAHMAEVHGVKSFHAPH